MHFLNRLIVILIVLAAFTLIACWFMPQLREQKEMAARLEALKKENEEQKALLAQRLRQVDLLKNDPAYVETIARDKLDLMKDGETVFRLEPTQASADKPGLKLRSQP